MIASPLVLVYAERGAYPTRPVYGCVEATGRTRRLGPVVLGGAGVEARSVSVEGRRLTWTDLDGEHAFRL